LADTHDTTPLGRWKEGAKALAAFQANHYATGQSGKNQHHGSKAMTLKDVTSVCKDGAQHGLSHSFMFRPLGENYAVARVTLWHESGESIFSEVGFSTEFKNARSQEQALGSAKTYYHKYMLSGLYGLANDDDNDDDGEGTVNQSASVKAPVKPPSPPPKPVTVPEPQSVVISDAGLSEDEKALCLAIVKDPDTGAAVKQQFMAKFYPSAEKLFKNMITSKEHKAFLDEAQIAAIAAAGGVPF
jgi:hypothetical protein